MAWIMVLFSSLKHALRLNNALKPRNKNVIRALSESFVRTYHSAVDHKSPPTSLPPAPGPASGKARSIFRASSFGRHRWHTTWCAPLRSTLLSGLKLLPGREIAEEIMRQESVHELGKLLLGWTGNGSYVNRGRRVAYNLDNFAKVNGYQTVEFRQHEGTLSGERVVLWAKFCVALLEFAGRVGWKNLKAYCEREIEREEMDGTGKLIGDVCHVIDFEEVMRAWDVVDT